LAYFDIFNYPLTNEEVRRFLQQRYDQLVVDEVLCDLLKDQFIFKLNHFYSLQNRPELVAIRIQGNKRAAQLLKIAKRVSKILSWFPFVESVAVSGSLSKNFADEKADIDFFIITSANRLWTARTCMHIFKKFTFLAGKQNWFCMNYYIDEMKMEIIEKNIFTAMEIVTLIPMQGTNCFKKFIEANSWTSNYFQEQPVANATNLAIKKTIFRKNFEKIFIADFGNAVEKLLMKITDKRWKRKTLRGKVNDHGERMAMVTDPYFSKPDPKNLQYKIVHQFEEKFAALTLKDFTRVDFTCI
jgi:predicted nucleotidyltransferase